MLIFNSNFGGEFMSEHRKIELESGDKREYLLTTKCSLHG